MSDLKEFKLPDVGEGLTEADIVRWHVKPGDQVTVNQIIVEIETAKAVVELPSPYEGTSSRAAGARGPDRRRRHADHLGATSARSTGERPVRPRSPAGGGRCSARSARPRTWSRRRRSRARPSPAWHGSPAPKAERQAVLVGYGVKLGTTSQAGPQDNPQSRPERGTPAAAAAPAAAGSRAAAARRRPRPRPPAADGSGPAAPRWPSRRSARWPGISASTSPL